MNGTTFDSLASGTALRDSGFTDRQAESVVAVVRDSRADLVTGADLDNAVAGLEARLETKIERAIDGLTWRMFAIGGLIVAAIELL